MNCPDNNRCATGCVLLAILVIAAFYFYSNTSDSGLKDPQSTTTEDR